MATNDEKKSRVSRNKNKSPIRSEIDTTLNTFSFNVDKAQKDAKKIYQNLTKQNDAYLRATTKDIQRTYKGIYAGLIDQHKTYIRGLVYRESQAYNKVAEIWGRPIRSNFQMPDLDAPPQSNTPRSGSRSSNTNNRNQGTKDNPVHTKSTPTDIALSTLNSTLRYWGEKITSGAQAFIDVYTANFNKYTTAFNTNYKGLSKIISESTSTLDNTIGTRMYNVTKDLLPALERVASSGLQGSNAIAKATDDVIAKKIMPYLETGSSTWTNMYATMSASDIKTIKGQQLQLKQTEAGSRLLQSGVINSLTDELEPLLRDIEYNTSDKTLGEYQSLMENLVSTGKMTEREAYDYVKSNLVDVQKNQYAALTSGDLTKQLVALAMANGGNGISGLRTTLGIMGRATNNLTLSAVGSSIGSTGIPAYTTSIISSMSNALDQPISDLTDKAESYYDDAIKGIGDVVHNTDQLNNALENLGANTLGRLGKDIGQPMIDTLKKILSGVTTIIQLYVAGGLAGGITGKHSGLLGILGSRATNFVSAPAIGGWSSGVTAGAIASGAGLIAGGITLVDGITDIAGAAGGQAGSGARTRGAIKVGSTLTGAGIGAIVGLLGGPIGAGIGAAVGGLTGELVSAFYKSDYEKMTDSLESMAKNTEDAASAIDQLNTANEDFKKLTDYEKSLTQDEAASKKSLIESTKKQIEYEKQLASIRLGETLDATLGSLGEDQSVYNKATEEADKYLDTVNLLSDATEGKLPDGMADLLSAYGKANAAANYYGVIGDTTAAEMDALGINVSGTDTWDTLATKLSAGISEYDGYGVTRSQDGTFALKQGSGSVTYSYDAATGGYAAETGTIADDAEEAIQNLQNLYAAAVNQLNTNVIGVLEGATSEEQVRKAVRIWTGTDGLRYRRDAFGNSIDGQYGKQVDSLIAARKADLNINKLGIGEYKTGLDYVPYDNFPAILHEGESVLTKADSSILKALGRSSSKDASNEKVVDAIKWAVSQILPAISSQVTTSTNTKNELEIRLPNGSTQAQYNKGMVSMLKTSLAN